MAELSHIDLDGEVLEIADEKAREKVQTLDEHIENTDNPHGVTKEQVGLGNVPNVSTNEQTPTYSVASELAELSSGEKLAAAFSKIAKVVKDFIKHLANVSNPHNVTKEQVGLGNVDNTSDADKPVSTAQQTALDAAYANSNYYTDAKIAELINGAPTTLDTLKEIADAMTEHEDVVEALNEAIGTKANESEFTSHVADGYNPHKVTKEQVGLGNVDNTADADKPISKATQEALDAIAEMLSGISLFPCTESYYESLEEHDSKTLYVFVEETEE